MKEPEIDLKLVIHREPEMRKEGYGLELLAILIPIIILLQVILTF